MIRDLELWTAKGTNLLNCLIKIGKQNAGDINGENDNLWYETEDLGFKSNLRYLKHITKDIKDKNTLIDTFLQTWLSHDPDYYSQYDYHYEKIGKKYFVAVAVRIDY